MLDAGAGFASYAWSTSDNTQTITVTNSGTYSVTVTDSFGCEGFDTIVVTVLPAPIVDLGPDTSICIGDILTLDAGPGVSYSWLPSGSTQTIDVTTSGTYSVTVTGANGCQGTDEITVTVVSQMNATITPAGPVCSNDSAFSLTAASPGGTWSGTGISLGGLFNPSVSGPGTFEITYTIPDPCGNSDTVVITVYESPQLQISHTDETCIGASDGTAELIVNGGVQPYDIVWSNGESEDSITGLVPGTYFALVTDLNGCIVSETFIILGGIDDCYPSHIVVPDIFSPNGDGENDVLFVLGQGVRQLEFVIYSRWGEKVFETSDMSVGWDGTHRGKPMDTAVFAYYLRAIFNNGEEKIMNGDILLIR